MDKQCKKFEFASLHNLGATNIELWMDGEIYPTDPIIRLQPHTPLGNFNVNKQHAIVIQFDPKRHSPFPTHILLGGGKVIIPSMLSNKLLKFSHSIPIEALPPTKSNAHLQSQTKQFLVDPNSTFV